MLNSSDLIRDLDNENRGFNTAQEERPVESQLTKGLAVTAEQKEAYDASNTGLTRAADSLYDAIGQPVEKVATLPLSLAGVAIDMVDKVGAGLDDPVTDYLKDKSDQLANRFKKQDILTDGVDPANPNTSDKRQEGTLGDFTEFAAALGTAGLVSKGARTLATKIANRGVAKDLKQIDALKEVAQKKLTEANTPTSILTAKEAGKRSELAMNEVKKATEEASNIAVKINSNKVAKSIGKEANNMSFKDRAKETYGWLGIVRESAVTDVKGTVGTAQLYSDTSSGGATFDKEAGVNFFKEAVTEAVFGVAFAVPTVISKGTKINNSVREATAIYNNIQTGKKTWFNVDKDVMKQMQKDMPVQQFNGTVDTVTNETLFSLHHNKKYGMYMIGDGQESMILVSPKLGSMIVHVDSKTGRYYIKGADPKYLATDVVVANNGEAPLFTPDVQTQDLTAMQGSSHGYDSLHTASVNIVPPNAANLNQTDPITFSGAGAFDTGTVNKVGQWFAESDILPKDGVKLKPSMFEYITNNILAGKNFPLSNISAGGQLQFRDLLSRIEAERLNRKEFFEQAEVNSAYLQESKTFVLGAFKNFANANKSKTNDLSPIVKTLFNTDGSTTLKQSTSNLMNVATERALIRAYAKIQKLDDGKGNEIAGFRPEDVPDIASMIANEFTDLTGFTNSLETQLFTNKLTEALQQKLGKEDFTAGMSSRTLDSGEKILTFRDRAGDHNGIISTKPNIGFEKLFEGNALSNSDINTLARKAQLGYVSGSLSGLNRYTTLNKSKARIGSENISLPPTIEGLDTTQKQTVFSNFTNMLDKQSMPIHYAVEADGTVKLGNDAQAYMRLANTVYKYRGGSKAAIELLDELSAKNDVELAIMLEKDIPESGKTADNLIDAFDGNLEKAAEVLTDVDSLRNETEGHYILAKSKGVDGKGLTFPVMKVSTTRMQYVGDINPQQGYLSKILFGSTSNYKFDSTNPNHINFQSDAIRWSLDEGSYLDILTQKQKDIYNIDDNFKGQRYKGSNEDLNAIAGIITSSPEFILPENATLKDRMVYRNLANLESSTELIVEYDAITSMQGITNAVYTIEDSMTGINADISPSGADIYMRVGDKIQQQGLFSFFHGIDEATARKFAKDPTMEGGYGMDPEAIVKSLFESYIKKAWMTGTDTDLVNINKDLKNKINFTMPDFNKFTKTLKSRIDRLEISTDLKNALNAEINKIASNESQSRGTSLSSARTLSYFDNLESTLMKVDADIRTKADIIDQLNLTKDAIKVNSFIQKVDTAKFNSITAKEIEAVTNVLAKHTKGVMGDILDTSFGERFVNFKNIVTKEFAHGNVATMAMLDGTKITTQMKDSLYAGLSIKKSELKAYKNAFSGNTLGDFVDFLYSKGHDPLISNTLYNMLPGYYNVFGDKVLYVAAKNSGFNAESGLQYLGLTMINNPLPYVFHSMDASIVGIAAKQAGPMNMRWDAFYDSRSLSHAKRANKAMGFIYTSNPIDSIQTAYNNNNEIIATYSGRVDLDKVIDDTARRAIVGNGDVLTADGKQAKIDDIKNILYDPDENTLYNNIIHEKEIIDERLADITPDTNLNMNNYANGRVESAYTGSAGSLRRSNFVTEIGDVKYGASSFDVGNLTNINTKNVKVDSTYNFQMMSKSRANFAMDIGKLTFKDKASYNTTGRHVSLNMKPTDPKFWKQLSHELVHAVGLKLDGEASVAQKFGGIAKELDEAGIRVGEYKDGAPVVYERGLLEQKTGLTPIDTDMLYGNELSASMLDNLISNELLHANRELIAKMQGTNELKAEALIMIDKTGRVHELYTVSDLTSFLDAQGINTYGKTIRDYTDAVHGIINGSTHVRDIIFDKPKAKFETTLKDTFQNLENINKAVIKASEVIQDTPFLELFELSAHKEIIESVLAQTKGVDKIIYDTLNSVMDGLRKSFETEFGDQAPKFARLYGNAWMMGLNKLFFADMGPEMNFMNINLEGDLVRNGTMTSYSDMQHRFQQVENKFFDTISGNRSTPDIAKAVARLKQDVKALANGTSGTNVDMLARKLEVFAKRNMDNTTYIDFRLAAQKLSSMQIIGKNSKHYDKFKSVYAEVNTRGDIFKSYMEHANIHENPNTLFGENVDMQFVEHGKTVKAVKQDANANYSPGDVVGTAVLPDGTKYDIITIEAGEKIIAAQDSNLITMELSKMETGTFTQQIGDFTVELNGQRIITEGSAVDKSIITQLARNVYARKKEDIAKDLGYRQYQVLRDKGIILTYEEKMAVDQASDGKESKFKKMSDNNPIAKALGTDFYFDKRWQHYFEGTPGINVSRLAQSLTNDKQFAGFVENMILGIYNTTNVLKRFILIARPQSYINSAISSMLIYAHHATGLQYKKDYNAARASIKKYKKLINTYADAVVSKDQAAADKAWALVKKDPTHKMMEAGLSDTIKADVYKAGTNKEMAGYGAILRATGSHQYANAVKTMFMSEQVPLFKKAGDMFEATEMLPKLMLYHNKLGKLGHQKAATTTIMAYPSYNNLNPTLNLLNIVNPYMKFFASTPRMVMYAGNQNMRNMMIGVAIANGIVPASYAMQDEEEAAKYEFYKDNGFVKIPFLPIVYPTFSLFPIYKDPFDTPFGNSLFGIDFIPGVAKNIFNEDSYLPGKYVGGE